MNKHYHPIDTNVWQGRIDSHDDYDAFRWHQWVKPINLMDDTSPPFDGELGICFIGFCCDDGVTRNKGRSGAAKGPRSIRKELVNLPCHFQQALKIYDGGNIYCEDISLEEGQAILAGMVDRILALNLYPIVLGGGHEIAFGHYNGLQQFFSENDSNNKIGIVNFDAHFDLRPYPNGGSSGTMFRQIADSCAQTQSHFGYMCLGIQKRSNTLALFKSARELGVQYILAKDMVDQDIWHILEQVDSFIKKHNQIYITICADVFSAAFAPGVSAALAVGLHPEQVLKIIKYIVLSGKTVSFDIAEVSPRFDQDNTTSNLAAVLIFALINTLASLKNLDISVE